MNSSSGFSIVESYSNFMLSKSDPRTSSWLFLGSPGPLVTLLVSYLYFCISAGPKYMKDKKPYDLKNIIRVYNISQVISSIYLVYLGLTAGWLSTYNFKCQPVDYSNDPEALRMAFAVWFYFICKLIELLDTVFFVFRKKSNQVTFLHLYHHTMMPICGWIGAKFLPGGHGTLLGLINSFIHIIMYSYYFLSSYGPEVQKYLWWKKHLTALQMIQFCIIFCHNFQVMFRTCNYPKPIAFLLALNAAAFLYMFGSFYHRTYVLSKKQALKNAKKLSIINESNGKVKSS